MADEKSRSSRRTFLKRLGVAALVPGAGAVYLTQIEPFWPEFHEFDMPIKGLGSAFDGLRITHLTDLHICDHASVKYMRGVVNRVNEIRPDMVVITGDIVTRSSASSRARS